MRLRLGAPRRALVVAPHPDDEVIAAAGLIATLVRRGARVTVAVVTDGAGSHRASRRWPRRRLIAARRRESRRALRRLGVPAGEVHFLGLPDGAGPGGTVGARRGLRRMLASCRPGLIVAPAADDAHPDHRATAAALVPLVRGRRLLGYRVWPPHRLRAGKAYRHIGLPVAAKRSLIRCHATQTGAIHDDPAGFAIAPHELAVFAHPGECFREVRQ